MQVESKDVSFQSDGLTLKGTLYYPLPKNGFYGVLCLHGGSNTSDNRFLEFQKFLAAKGYASFFFYSRGVGLSEGRFEDGTLNRRLTDARAALKFFRESGVVDPDHIAVAAGSMGAHVAVRLAEAEKKVKVLLLHSAAAYVGEAEDKPLNGEFTQIIRSTSDWDLSPVWPILARFKGSLQVAYGAEDNLIPPEVKNRYKKAAQTGRYLEIPHGQHKLLVPGNKLEENARQTLFAESLAFLNLGFR